MVVLVVGAVVLAVIDCLHLAVRFVLKISACRSRREAAIGSDNKSGTINAGCDRSCKTNRNKQS